MVKKETAISGIWEKGKRILQAELTSAGWCVFRRGPGGGGGGGGGPPPRARLVFCTVRCFLCSSALFMFCGEISDFSVRVLLNAIAVRPSSEMKF